MDHLQACYFCGAAEDDPLREVTVTPRRRRDDPDAKVSLTLCRSCENKLERVLDGLFEHVESRQTADFATDHEPANGDTADAPPVDRIDIGAEQSSDAPTETDRQPASTATQDDTPAASTTDSDDGADDSPDTDDERRVTARATMNATDGLDEISVDQYNRVMRLLQNRELPMDRAAFVRLATNAYEMREETVEALLDKVIEDGSLAVRDGELVRPDAGQST